MREDLVWQGVFSRNGLLDAPILNYPPALWRGNAGADYPRPVTDEDVTSVQEWLQLAGLPSIAKNVTHQAVELVAAENTFHPIRDYLDALVWDDVDRLDDWLTDCFGVEKTEYAMAVGRMFLIAMVARIYDPGCQADYMLILEGDQGVKKSSACRILAGPWFSDSMPENVASRDAALHLRGKWLVEIAELHTFKRSETPVLKAFITRREDIYRAPYGHHEVHRKRQNLFVGTTNQKVYLLDPTGGRRFWPVVTTEIDLELLISQRDQLLAEGIARYRRGEHWWPDPAFEAEHIAPEQDERFEADAWEMPIAKYLEDPKGDGSELPLDRVTIFDIAKHGLFFDTPRIGTADQRRVTAILQGLGWKRAKRGHGGVRWWARS